MDSGKYPCHTEDYNDAIRELSMRIGKCSDRGGSARFSANLSETVSQSRMRSEGDEMLAAVTRVPRETSFLYLSFAKMASRTCLGCGGSLAVEVRISQGTRGSGANATQQLAVATRVSRRAPDMLH